MKRSIVLICVAVSLVVLGIVASQIAVSSARADLGNTGMLVRCTKPDYWIAPNAESDLVCYAADGTSFTTVPSAHYVLFTDMVIAPFSGTTTGAWGVNLTVPGSTINVLTWFTWSASGTYTQHFTTPFLVLRAGEKVAAQNFGSSPTNIAVQLYGLLTTNATYLPLINK